MEINSLDLTLDRTNLEIPEEKLDSEIWAEWIVSAIQQNEELYQSRLMQRAIAGILAGIKEAKKGRAEFTETEIFLLRNLFDSAKFPITVNQCLVQFLDKLEL